MPAMASLLSVFKRRNVFKVGVTHVIVLWVLSKIDECPRQIIRLV
jgi:hypothetical protein